MMNKNNQNNHVVSFFYFYDGYFDFFFRYLMNMMNMRKKNQNTNMKNMKKNMNENSIFSFLQATMPLMNCEKQLILFCHFCQKKIFFWNCQLQFLFFFHQANYHLVRVIGEMRAYYRIQHNQILLIVLLFVYKF